MERNQIEISNREQFPYGPVTTGLFLLILFLLPFTLLFRLMQAQFVESIGTFFVARNGPSTSFQGYMFIIIPVTFLATWSFLRVPAITIRLHKMESLELHHPALANRIHGWGQIAQQKYQPMLLWMPTDRPLILAFGTWRHQYISIAEGALNLWSRPEELRAVILHEHGHIATGDTWKARLALEYVEWFFVILVMKNIGSIVPTIFGRSDLAFGGLFGTIFFSFSDAITGLFFILSVRYLFRLREYGADHFSSTHLGESQTLKDALVRYSSLASQPQSQKLGFMSEGVQNTLTTFLRFHPSTISRLDLIDNPGMLIEDIMGISVITGMATGIITTWFWTENAVAILISGMLIFGVPILLLMIPSSAEDRKLSKLKLVGYFLRSALSFSTGVAVTWALYIFPSSLLKLNVNNTSSHFVTGGEFRFNLAFSLDVLLVIVIIMPIVIAGLAYFAWVLSKVFKSNPTNMGFNRAPIIMAWISELPGLFVVSWMLGRWWNGYYIAPSLSALLIGSSLSWALLVFLSNRIFGVRPRKFNNNA